MDIARPNVAKEKRRKRIIYAAIAGVVLIAITVLLARLKPAAPRRSIQWLHYGPNDQTECNFAHANSAPPRVSRPA